MQIKGSYFFFALIPLLSAGCGAAAPSGGEPQVMTLIAETPAPAPAEPTFALPAPTATELSKPEIDPARLFSEAFNQLTTGRILYNPPQKMTVGKQERVEIRITLSATEALAEGLKGSGEPVEESLKVSQFMKVSLLGDNFSITPLNSEEQALLPEGYTEWAWNVTPLEGGPQTLVLRVTARVKLAGYPDEQRDLEVIERQIQVDVNWGKTVMTFLGSNLEWLIPLVIIPFLLGAFNRLRNRSHRNRRER